MEIGVRRKLGKQPLVKKITSLLLVIWLLLTTASVSVPTTRAAAKDRETKAIAIVFDNSGSMYDDGDMSWCRATYAMEVFASMLNEGDTLLIYPMHSIEVGGKEYTREAPLKITDSAQAPTVRSIFTKRALGTPIETVDNAAIGLREVNADQKYMIVLTDGDVFYYANEPMTPGATIYQLDARFDEYAGEEMSIMYLGVGERVVMPEKPESEYFIKKQASDSKDVLSALTEMCNLIFGRDILPKTHITKTSVEFDISMSKLIVFVQGENVSNVKVYNSLGEVGDQINSASLKYGTAGCGNYDCVPDTTLQGMMVTYVDCPAGEYTIEYTGTATSVEAYYEPDADLDFVFTEADGTAVDPYSLYEGEYKVGFGLKDARTGQLISSELLGNPSYVGSYFINGLEVSFLHEGQSGEVPVSLKMGDTFEANLTVTYLSGYTITKDSSDFGWPDGGISVAARPAGDFRLEITGGQEEYNLQELEEGEPYIAKVYYQGQQVTGRELEKVELMWQPETSNVEIMEEFANDHYKLTLHYKNPEAPEATVCGECTVSIYAFYTPEGTSDAEAVTDLTYNVVDDYSPLTLELNAPQDYFVISELGESPAIVATVTLNGKKLTAEECENLVVAVDCNGVEYTQKINPEDSTCTIQLQNTPGIEEGDYQIKVSATYTDHIGRTSQADSEMTVTLGTIPMWLKWFLLLLLLLLLIIITLIILHIKVLPTKAHINKREASLIFDGEDESKATTFTAKVEKGNMTVHSKYGGVKAGLTMDVKPGKESYLRKPHQRRSAEVKSASVRKYGNATILEASIGSIKYVLNEDTNKLERVPKNDKPFVVKHGTTVSYSGTMNSAGIPKPFTVTSKLNFKKK